MKVIIQVEHNGPVECYGEWREDSNFECVFDNERFDGCYADGGGEDWSEVAHIVAEYAIREGTQLLEMTAC